VGAKTVCPSATTRVVVLRVHSAGAPSRVVRLPPASITTTESVALEVVEDDAQPSAKQAPSADAQKKSPLASVPSARTV
jgi:hypothetical protein